MFKDKQGAGVRLNSQIVNYTKLRMFCIIAITAKKKRLADMQVFFIVSAIIQRVTSTFEHGLNG